MKLQFLGTGTSTGVPQLGCTCEVCTSNDARDNRLRCSALLTVDEKKILIDCTPDFRYQALRASIPHLDALLITHSHYDHTGGIDDLRTYSYEKPLPVFAEPNVINDIRARLPYCFMENPYPGIPRLDVKAVAPLQSFMVEHIEVTPLRVMHYNLPIVGYRIGKMAYITDCLTMPQETIEQLQDLDVLVLNALRRTPHISHQTLDDALALIEKLAPRKAYLTHMSHHMGLHRDIVSLIPSHVEFAYDGLCVEF